MNQKNVLSLVIDGLYQMENYVQGWRDMENIPSIEKDLVQRKLQQIYDQIKHLNTNTEPLEENTTTTISEVSSKTLLHEPAIATPGPVHEIEFEKPTEIIKESKPLFEEIPVVTEPVKHVVEVTVSKTQVETENIKEVPKETITEKHSHSHKLINETIKTRTVMDVSSKLKAAPIPSIQSAINLNDKFLFIRELFKNNNLLYNQTIERLNSARNFDEAMTIVEKEFAWDMNEPLVIKLIELIKRKHNA